jgi:hypothetical protein
MTVGSLPPVPCQALRGGLTSLPYRRAETILQGLGAEPSPEEQPMLDFLMDAAAGCFLIVFFVMFGYGLGYIPRFLLNWIWPEETSPTEH